MSSVSIVFDKNMLCFIYFLLFFISIISVNCTTVYPTTTTTTISDTTTTLSSTIIESQQSSNSLQEDRRSSNLRRNLQIEQHITHSDHHNQHPDKITHSFSHGDTVITISKHTDTHSETVGNEYVTINKEIVTTIVRTPLSAMGNHNASSTTDLPALPEAITAATAATPTATEGIGSTTTPTKHKNPMLELVLKNTKTAVPAGPKDPAYCDRPWPKLELFIPMGFSKDTPERNMDWKNAFLPSFLLFWPVQRSNTSITFLFDEELKNSEIMKEYFLDHLYIMQESFNNNPQGKLQFPQINIKYHEHPVSEAWNHTTNKVNYALLPYSSGYDRQQYMGFIADLHSDADYIGLADRDTMFHSFVDREDIFVDGKPVVHPLLIRILHKLKIVRDWPKSTYNLLGKEMPMICMSYFPVTIKRSHFKDMRDYMTKRHKLSNFDEVYQRVFKNVGFYSQFCIMCTYLFWFKRDEYSWFVHDMDLWWNGNEPRPIWGHWGDKSIYTDEMKELRPYIALHARYRYHRAKVVDVPEAILNQHSIYTQSVCSHPTQTLSYPNMNCSLYRNKYSYFDEQFSFETSQYDENYGKDTAQAAFDKRMSRFEGCDLNYANFSLHYILDKSNYNEKDFEKLLTKKLSFH